MATGLLASIALILVGPSVKLATPPLFPLENPGILSIPLGFAGAVLGTLLGSAPEPSSRFDELAVRANTGLGAEKATTS